MEIYAGDDKYEAYDNRKGWWYVAIGKKNYDVIQVAYISDGDTGKRRREKFSKDYTRERIKKVEGAT